MAKPTKDADKIGASEANQPTRKGVHQPRQRKPRTRSGRAAAETNSAAAELRKARVKNSALSITNDERPEKTALKPKPRSKGADTAPVSVSSPDMARASTKRALLIGMLERAPDGQERALSGTRRARGVNEVAPTPGVM